MNDARPATRTVAEYASIEHGLTEAQARELQTTAGARLTVAPSAAGYRITASSYVGAVSVRGFLLYVKPKVPVRNLLHLLTWSTQRLQFDQSDLDFAAEEVTAALAALYARMLERTLVLGIDRAYVEEEARLIAIRGRIYWPAQSRSVGLATPVACRYDEWSMNTHPNRLVKAAAQVLLHQPAIALTDAHGLRRLLALLDLVGPLDPGDLAGSTNLTRLNGHYDAVTRLARLVLRASGTSHTVGAVKSPAFLINMNDVFEDFVYGRLRESLTGSLQVTCHRVVPLGTRGQVPGEPDYTFTDLAGRDCVVADAKYKLTTAGRGRAGDYYQLLAYCTTMGLPRGILIYGDSEGDLPPVSVEVRRRGTILETFRLGLSGDPSELAAEVERLAQHIDWAAQVTRAHPIAAPNP
jgi:5-methylcytosine-specific restriction enzyme subunit McrC